MGDTTMATLGSGVLVSGDNIISLKAGGVILAGEAVGFEDTGVSGQVVAATQTTKGALLGVALHDAASGDYISIATVGCVCYCTEGKGSTIDAGDYVTVSDVAGGLVPYVEAAASTCGVLGIALDDFAANKTGKILVAPHSAAKAS